MCVCVCGFIFSVSIHTLSNAHTHTHTHTLSLSLSLLHIYIYICFYHSAFSKKCLRLYYYIHNVSANMFSDFLQVFVELESLQKTSKHGLYLIYGDHLTITGYKCNVFLHSYLPAVRIEPATTR